MWPHWRSVHLVPQDRVQISRLPLHQHTEVHRVLGICSAASLSPTVAMARARSLLMTVDERIPCTAWTTTDIRVARASGLIGLETKWSWAYSFGQPVSRSAG